MRDVKREVNTPRFVPDYIATSLVDVDFEALKKRGIKYIAFDADSTLVPYRGIVLAPQTKSYLLRQRKLFKKWCIASNRPTNDLQDLGMSIDAQVIRAGILKRKPAKRYFRKVLSQLHARPSEVAMIGDKLLADMFGGKRSGLVTVWVEHLGKDSIVDRITRLRTWEKKLLKSYISK
jgi:uncharacterized protein